MSIQGQGRAQGNNGKMREGNLSGFGAAKVKAANRWRKRHLVAINAVAPAYFFLFIWARVYLETAVFAPIPFFSYYTLCHHMLWFGGTFLTMMLVMHFILKVPIKDLLILCYGVTLTAVPLIYALITGEKLRLTYLRGDFGEIFSHAVTFVWSYKADRALSMELALIFFGITGLAYLISKKPARALLTGISAYTALMIWAVHWVGRHPHKYAVFSVSTWMASNCLIAIILLHIFSFLVVAVVWRAGLLTQGKSVWLQALMAGVLAWAAFSFVMWKTQWFVLPFDIVVSGLPAFSDAALFLALWKGRDRGVSRLALGVFTALFLIQLSVMGPLLVRADEGLITQGELYNRAKRLEAILLEH